MALGDLVEIFPGEVAPVDGELVDWTATETQNLGAGGGWSTAAVVAFDECLRWKVVDCGCWWWQPGK